ncbi:hypothetical protein M3Y97_00337800 [Aphelenchoides bicaudatus]|nr:hypothetical protein M3Y97_00337800 [Aphelenchoides bicaudatus]
MKLQATCDSGYGLLAQQRALPTPPQFQQQRFNRQLRPATQPPLRRIQLNTQNQARPRAPQPSTAQRRPAVAPPIRVQPASVPAQTPVRRPTPPLQIRPLTQQTAPRAQPFNRAPNRPPAAAFTPGVRRPTVPRPTQPLAPPLTALRSTASTTLRRPVPQSTPSFASTNSVGPAGPPTTGRLAVRPSTPANAHPPGNLPPSNSVVDELNRADDFMAVAARLKLRRFVRHRNRRRADFILQQQLKNR